MKKLFLSIVDLFRVYGLPMCAGAGLILAFCIVHISNQNRPAAEPITEPATAPYKSYVSGSGIVEAKGENISIASFTSGVVADVFVKVGDVVAKGAPLFLIDDRTQKAAVSIQQSAYNVALAQEADAKAQLDFALAISDKRAMSADDMTKRRNAYAIAQAKAAQAKSALEEAETSLDLLTVRAPKDATILKVNVRPGEFAPAQIVSAPLMVLGDNSALWVRVDIDENDAWRVDPGAHATASLRGNKEIATSLRYVRIEPYVVPKRSLTGDNSERVDTRVLQILYEFEPKGLPVYVGQLMDVFIEAKPHV